MDGVATLACRDPAICQGLCVLCPALSKWPAAAASEDEALPRPCSTLPRIQSKLLRRGGERVRGNGCREVVREDEGKAIFFCILWRDRESSRPSHTAPEINYFAYPLGDTHKHPNWQKCHRRGQSMRSAEPEPDGKG